MCPGQLCVACLLFQRDIQGLWEAVASSVLVRCWIDTDSVHRLYGIAVRILKAAQPVHSKLVALSRLERALLDGQWPLQLAAERSAYSNSFSDITPAHKSLARSAYVQASQGSRRSLCTGAARLHLNAADPFPLECTGLVSKQAWWSFKGLTLFYEPFQLLFRQQKTVSSRAQKCSWFRLGMLKH